MNVNCLQEDELRISLQVTGYGCAKGYSTGLSTKMPNNQWRRLYMIKLVV